MSSGAANLGTNNVIAVNLLSVGDVAGTYKIIQAGSLTGGSGLTSAVGSLPFLFDSSLVTTVPNEVSLAIRLKCDDELGINRSEGDILDAVLALPTPIPRSPGSCSTSTTAKPSRTRCSKCFPTMPAARSKTAPRARGW